MVAAAKLALAFDQGSTWTYAFQLSTGGTVADGGTPINLTGYVVRMQMRTRVNSSTVLLDCNTTNGRMTITDAASGKFSLTVDAATTAAIPWTSAVYDLEIESGGVVTSLIYGSVKVRQEVTR